MKRLLFSLIFASALHAQFGVQPWKRSGGVISPKNSTDTVSIGTTVHDPATSEPTCNSGNRGHIVRVQGGAGVADTYRQCVKDATDAYAWAAFGGSSNPSCPAGTWSNGACEVKTVIAYTDSIFTAAALTADKTLFQLPATAKVVGITIYHTAAFAGTSITAVTASVGRTGTGNEQDYAPAWNIFQAAATTTLYDDGGHFSMDMAAHNLIAHFIGVGANWGNGSTTVLTAGSVTIWVRYIVLS